MDGNLHENSTPHWTQPPLSLGAKSIILHSTPLPQQTTLQDYDPLSVSALCEELRVKAVGQVLQVDVDMIWAAFRCAFKPT